VERTWDGLPVAPEKPYASCVVVWRDSAGGGREFLLLHRAHEGPSYAGDWAWTPPSGARLPGETPAHAAARELQEETGLALDIQSAEGAAPSDAVALFVARAPHDAAVRLDPEHDRFVWSTEEEAVAKCLPAEVGACIANASAWLSGQAIPSAG
jgi:8-oxo-dGTP pyrophosphatase MutT (NUDIX family)